MQLDVIMTCYNPLGSPRGDYAIKALKSLGCYLQSPIPIRLIVADDGSEDTSFIPILLSVANSFWPDQSHISTNSGRKGVGGSINKAIEYVSDFWMYTTDDWVLTDTLNLSLALPIFQRGYDIVRIGPIHPNLQCITRFDTYWWLEISVKTGFAFATRPFIATKNLYNRIGKFREKVDAYITERDYSDRIATLGAKIAYMGHISLVGPWEHIGEYEVGTITP